MSTKRILVFLGILTIFAVALSACASDAGPAGEEGPQGDQGPAGDPLAAVDLSCTDCHDDTTRLFQASQQWAVSTHGSGTAYGRGTSGSCSGCHSSEGFTAMIEAGMTAAEFADEGTPPVVSSKTNCRTCHEIHTTYTGDDFSLTTTDAVTLYAFEDTTYDGGMGNLCANCHQPRRPISDYPADENGLVNVSSSHWGPHHGPQSAMLLGVGGAGVDGSAGMHAAIEDTCVGCHVNEANGYDHVMASPNVATCTVCHTDAEDFDIGGVQTEVEELSAEVGEMLQILDMADAGGHPVPGKYPAAEAYALWDYIMIAIEDGSNGVHNPKYTVGMLEAAVAALEPAVEEVSVGVVTAIDEEAFTISVETEDGEAFDVVVAEDFDFTAFEVDAAVKVRGTLLEDGTFDADWIHVIVADTGDH